MLQKSHSTLVTSSDFNGFVAHCVTLCLLFCSVNSSVLIKCASNSVRWFIQTGNVPVDLWPNWCSVQQVTAALDSKNMWATVHTANGDIWTQVSNHIPSLCSALFSLLVIFSFLLRLLEWQHTVVALWGSIQASRPPQHRRENRLHLISHGGGFKERDQESFVLMDWLQFRGPAHWVITS